jgi:hypothetical protein
LSDVIHEQNFLLQHNDQYMLDLENQLEAVAAPPPNPEEEKDPEEIQGESGVEAGPASPCVNLGRIVNWLMLVMLSIK